MIYLHQDAGLQDLLPTPLIIIISLFVINWIIRVRIKKNPQNKSLMKLSFLISFSMIAYTIYYFFFIR